MPDHHDVDHDRRAEQRAAANAMIRNVRTMARRKASPHLSAQAGGHPRLCAMAGRRTAGRAVHVPLHGEANLAVLSVINPNALLVRECAMVALRIVEVAVNVPLPEVPDLDVLPEIGRNALPVRVSAMTARQEARANVGPSATLAAVLIATANAGRRLKKARAMAGSD